MMERDPNTIWREFRSFKEERKFLDCELKCDDESILCHKLILYSFSPRFRHLLANLEHLDDPILTIVLPEVNSSDLKSTLDTLYVNLGTAEAEDDKELELVPELAKLFGFVDFDPMDTINVDTLASLKVEVLSENEEDIMDDDDDDYDEYQMKTDEDKDHMFDEDAFQPGGNFAFRKKRKAESFANDRKFKMARNSNPFDGFEEDIKVEGLKVSKRGRPKGSKTSTTSKKATKTKEEKMERIINPKNETKQRYCKFCNIYIGGKRNYIKHRKEIHHPEMKVKIGCRLCRREMSIYSFRIHYQRLHSSAICDECGKVFTNRQNMVTHIKKVHNKFKCEVCGKICFGHRALDSHNAEEHFKGSYPCEICGKTFGSHRRIVLHKYQSHRSKETMNFACDHCGKRFPTFKKRLNHVHSVHLKDYPFQCRYSCGAKYNDLNNLVRHEVQKHGKAYPTWHSFEHLKQEPKKK